MGRTIDGAAGVEAGITHCSPCRPSTTLLFSLRGQGKLGQAESQGHEESGGSPVKRVGMQTKRGREAGLGERGA